MMTTGQLDLLDDMPTDGMASRRAALGILDQVLGQKKMMDTVLDHDRSFLDLPQRDRAFVRMLIATILRRKGQLDDLIARCLNKGEIPRPASVKWILYLGLAQILFMDVPDHAAVDTSVTLAGSEGMDSKKGFINAILRRMTAEGRSILASQDVAALNIPGWLYQIWIRDYGHVRARDIALASLEEAAFDVSLKNADDAADLAPKLAAKMLPTGSLRRTGGGHVAALPGFEEGLWWVQDASSALPVKFFGDIKGQTVLDLCAAPGGKTAQLAARGAKVVALDRSAGRMAILAENMNRLGLSSSVQAVIEDGSVWNPREKYNYILLDAPCTATGTIRRHPDLLSLKGEKDQAGLESIQARLLQNAAEMLAPGGILIYCTCSLQKAEGEDQVNGFLLGRSDFRRLPIRKEEFGRIDGLVNQDGDVRVLPQHLKEHGGMDGFFVSRIQKIPAG